MKIPNYPNDTDTDTFSSICVRVCRTAHHNCITNDDWYSYHWLNENFAQHQNDTHRINLESKYACSHVWLFHTSSRRRHTSAAAVDTNQNGNYFTIMLHTQTHRQPTHTYAKWYQAISHKPQYVRSMHFVWPPNNHGKPNEIHKKKPPDSLLCMYLSFIWYNYYNCIIGRLPIAHSHNECWFAFSILTSERTQKNYCR